MGKTRIKKEDAVYVISGKDRDLSKPRRVLQVMQHHVRHDRVGLAVSHRKVLEGAEAQVDVVEAGQGVTVV